MDEIIEEKPKDQIAVEKQDEYIKNYIRLNPGSYQKTIQKQ